MIGPCDCHVIVMCSMYFVGVTSFLVVSQGKRIRGFDTDKKHEEAMVPVGGSGKGQMDEHHDVFFPHQFSLVQIMI